MKPSEKEVLDTPPNDTPHDKEVRMKEGMLTPAARFRFMERIKEFKRQQALDKKNKK